MSYNFFFEKKQSKINRSYFTTRLFQAITFAANLSLPDMEIYGLFSKIFVAEFEVFKKPV
jgi:hypothetical protein